MIRFDGPCYYAPRDEKRLAKQHEVIKSRMSDGLWRTLDEIQALTGYPQSSISAQLRHLRKPRFGSYVVEKRHRGDKARGLYEYRVSPPVFDETGQGAFQLEVG